VTIKSSGSSAANLGAGETQSVTIAGSAAETYELTVLGVDVSYTGAVNTTTSAAAAVTAINSTAALHGRVFATNAANVITLTYAVAEGNAAAAVDKTSATGSQTVVDNVSALSLPALSVTTATATNAQTLRVDAAGNDGVHVQTIAATGNLGQSVTITGAAGSVLGIGRVNAGTAALQTLRIDLADSAVLTSTGSAANGGEVDLDFTSVANIDLDLAAGATAKIDLTGEVVTASTFDVGTSATLLLGDGATTALGAAGSGSSFVFAGRGNVDFDTGVDTTDTVSIAGTTVTFNSSGLTTDTDGIAITSTATVRATITTGLGADTITGGDGNDILSGGVNTDTIDGGNGNDSLSGGDGVDQLTGGVGADTISGGASADLIVFTAATDSNLANAATDATGLDLVSWATGDLLRTNLVETIGAAGVQTITLAAGAQSTGATLTAAIAAALTEVANDVYLIKVVDNTTGGLFGGYYYIACIDTTFSSNDFIVRMTGVADTTTIALSGGDVLPT